MIDRQNLAEAIYAAEKLGARQEGLEEGRAIGRAIGREIGLNQGRAIGREIGLNEGRAIGREIGLNEGRTEGRAEGFTAGEYEKAVSVARYMLNDGLDIALIAKYTGLAESDISNMSQ